MKLNEGAYIRQEGLLSADLRKSVRMVMIGAGGIGGMTTLTLGKMGLAEGMEIWDPDIVEEHNVPTQIYRLLDAEKRVPKAVALTGLIKLFTGLVTVPKNSRWQPPVDTGAFYVSGVDSLEARREIWQSLGRNPPRLYVDARMGALVATIYAVTPDRRDDYARTLEGEAVKEPCTARATFFTGSGIAAAIGSIIFRAVRGESVPFETIIHWGTMEVITA